MADASAVFVAVSHNSVARCEALAADELPTGSGHPLPPGRILTRAEMGSGHVYLRMFANAYPVACTAVVTT